MSPARSSTYGPRAVERDAELALRAEPGEIDDAATEVFTVVHAAKGIVLSSSDITAPTVGIAERLDDAEARIDGLPAQLAVAESDDERAAVESELRRQRQQATVLRVQLDWLRERGRFARVTLRIESSASSPSWLTHAPGDVNAANAPLTNRCV